MAAGGARAVPARATRPSGEREFAFTVEDFEAIAEILYAKVGISLTRSKADLVYARLARRLRHLGLDSFAAYRARLGDPLSGEVETLVNRLTTNHTAFFRESHHLDHLAQHVLSPMIKDGVREQGVPDHQGGGRPGRKLRIWSAACSDGAEPYSIAVILLQMMSENSQAAGLLDSRILATDINTRILDVAARGHYPRECLEKIPGCYQTYTRPVPGGEEIAIGDEVRSMITFKPLNLLERWPMTGWFDAIFCRNVMIYFDTQTKQALVARLAEFLRPGGYLYIGHSETVALAGLPLTLCGRTTYRKVAG